MKLFNKPKWLRPEIDESLYWIHLGVIIFVVYSLMQFHEPGNNIFYYFIYLAIGDVVSHTLLGLD